MLFYARLISPGLNQRFWETRRWLDGGEYYYSPQLGELRIGADKPPVVRGGLLCDEMGMGKTLVVAALLVRDTLQGRAHPARSAASAAAAAAAATATAAAKDVGGLPAVWRPSLIVAPATLIRQWEAELRKSTRGGLLSVTKHEINDIVNGHGAGLGRARAEKAAQFCEADVVITSYRVLALDKTFQQVDWRRICLDEMQEVRSSTTKLAKACIALRSDYRWMISGTPLYTR